MCTHTHGAEFAEESAVKVKVRRDAGFAVSMLLLLRIGRHQHLGFCFANTKPEQTLGVGRLVPHHGVLAS